MNVVKSFECIYLISSLTPEGAIWRKVITFVIRANVSAVFAQRAGTSLLLLRVLRLAWRRALV